MIGILFIRPTEPPSGEPTIDGFTRMMAHALNNVEAGVVEGSYFYGGSGYKGVHTCSCGARSTNQNYLLDERHITNSLAVHYLAYHRQEVPKDELIQMLFLPADEAEPTPKQLQEPL